MLPTKRRFLAATLGEGGPYIIHLGGSVKAKKIVVVVTVVRLVVGWSECWRHWLTAGVVATIKKPGGRSTSPAMQIKCGQRWATSFLDCLNWECPTSELAPHSEAISPTRELPRLKDHKTSGLGAQGTRSRCPLDQETEGAAKQESKRPADQESKGPGDQRTRKKRPGDLVRIYVFDTAHFLKTLFFLFAPVLILL